jgi:hypothetical protein
MIELYLRARVALEPFLPLLLLAFYAVASLCAVYSLRRWSPGVWLRLEKTIPEGVGVPVSNILLGLPSVAFGAALAAFLNDGPITPKAAFWGAAGGTLAPVLHHILKALPVPYRGPVRDAAWKLLKKAGLGSLLLLAVGCAASSASYELCRAEARARFHEDAEKCADEACIDTRSKVETEDLRACR